MKKIIVIGAGQMGSRHLQALKTVQTPLTISVIDPSSESLKIAKQRYEQINGGTHQHSIKFLRSLEKLDSEIDVAIIATNSDIRRSVVEKILRRTNVHYFILEKLLFQKRRDYDFIGQLLEKKKSKAWVNCSMRMMPFYKNLKEKLSTSNAISYSMSGNQSGLVTNGIHFLDHIAFLTNCNDFRVSTDRLDKKIMRSKRKGYLELSGTLDTYFANGSSVTFTSFPTGNSPTLVTIDNGFFRCIIRESEQKAWVADQKTGWKWKEMDAAVPFQSSMTTEVVESILSKGSCPLPSYAASSKIHITYLETLLKFINKNSFKKYDFYPFT